jgi:hypothetical protein
LSVTTNDQYCVCRVLLRGHSNAGELLLSTIGRISSALTLFSTVYHMLEQNIGSITKHLRRNINLREFTESTTTLRHVSRNTSAAAFKTCFSTQETVISLPEPSYKSRPFNKAPSSQGKVARQTPTEHNHVGDDDLSKRPHFREQAKTKTVSDIPSLFHHSSYLNHRFVSSFSLFF